MENRLYYVVSDLHGEGLGLDLKNRRLRVIGDVVSRGRDNRSVIEILKYSEMITLGNHDVLFLRGMNGSLAAMANWLNKGGDTTLEDLGILDVNDLYLVLNEMFIGGVTHKVEKWIKNKRKEMWKNSYLSQLYEFLRCAKLVSQEDGICCIHAGFPVDKMTGRLITVPPNVISSHAAAVGLSLKKAKKISGLKGLEFTLGLEEMLSSGDEAKTQFVLSLLSDEKWWSPVNIKADFHLVIRDQCKLTVMFKELQTQARQLGKILEFIVFGHTPALGGRAFTDLSGKPRALCIDMSYRERGVLEVSSNGVTSLRFRTSSRILFETVL